ncbi:non-ribosomal peptide synthetase [Brevibacillus agri]|uniref:non-ribosomal peptide synthetase n=1 Tax=Brevibacillus agri TaxID=51101 RepID=UPI003D23A40F
MNPDILSLTTNKKELLLQKILKNRLEDSDKNNEIIPQSRETNKFEMSFNQKRLWVLEQLEGQGSAYHIPLALKLQGELNVPVLTKSIKMILNRHEVLRTTFESVNGEYYQVIQPETDIELNVTDLESLPEHARETEAWRILQEETKKPFDLVEGSLYRIVLIRTQRQHHILLFMVHHIVFDGWSANIFFKELEVCYQAFIKEEEPSLPPLPVQYADYSVWQKKQIEEKQEQLDYWKQKLSGNLPVLELPRNKGQMASQQSAGATEGIVLPVELTAKIRELAKQEGVSMFMALLAMLKGLLYRYTYLEDIIVGTPISNRYIKEVENLIGFFVNTLVLRTDLSKNPSFRELLGRVRNTCLEAYEHQDFPFEKLVEELNPEREVNRTPLFQVLFLLQNEMETLHIPGLEIDPIFPNTESAKFDLTVGIMERKQDLVINIQYKKELFSQEMVNQMLGHLQNLMEDVVTDPDKSLNQVQIMTEEERRKLMAEWNDTDSPISDDLLDTGFAIQVERQKDKPAVISAKRTLHYQELFQRANQWGRLLREQGSKPNKLVAVVMEKGWEQVVAVLGILQSGAAYLPIDPELPLERIWYLLECGEVEIVLTQTWIDQSLTWPEKIRRLSVDNEDILRGYHDHPLDKLQKSDDLAYVIFTSGTTGLPKGVMVPHRGAVNNIYDINRRFNVTSDDNVLALSSLSFDLSVYDIFGTLAAGGTIVIPDSKRVHDPNHWRELVIEKQITIWHSVPAFMKLFIENVTNNALPAGTALRLILLGGDWIPVSLPPTIVSYLPKAQVVSLGGVTEVSIWSSVYPINEINPAWNSIPYGRPMANQKLYILTEALELCPVGVIGELYIGGIGVTAGYWKDPERSDRSFIIHPHTKERLYRTGDHGRYMSDGNIEFLGRKDNQIKLRGYRIELGEIETALLQQGDIKEVVVSLQENTYGDKRLCAYFVAKEDRKVSKRELRSFLKKKIPEYMIPSFFEELPSMPLTRNGKVNRLRLPVPDFFMLERNDYVEPSTELEKMLSEAWKQILNVESVGIHDNFFDIGGDSILAIRIAAKMQELGYSLMPSQIFLYQTISELAEEIKQNEDLNQQM